MLHPDGCARIEVAQPFNQVAHGSNTDACCRQPLLDRDRTMILKVRPAFWNPCRAAIHALARPLTDKAETTYKRRYREDMRQQADRDNTVPDGQPEINSGRAAVKHQVGQ
jgi:hypothetical protein